MLSAMRFDYRNFDAPTRRVGLLRMTLSPQGIQSILRRLPGFIPGKKTPITVFLQAVSAGEKFAALPQTPSGARVPRKGHETA